MQTLESIADLLHTSLRQIVEALTAYASSLILLLQDVNYAMLGGLILFCARAAVDIPTAIDYWKERRAKNETKSDR